MNFVINLYRFFTMPNNGCSQSVGYLHKIMPEIIYYDVTQQAKCVDIPRILLVKKGHDEECKAFVRSTFQTLLFQLNHINATAIGNIAYIELHHNIPELRQEAADCRKAIVLRLQLVHKDKFTDQQKKKL